MHMAQTSRTAYTGPSVMSNDAVEVPSEALPRPSSSWLSRLLPWVISATVVAWLLWPYREPDGRAALLNAFAGASRWTIVVSLSGTILIWLTDAWATARTLERWGTQLRVGEACLIRGASALYDAINPALGQAVLTMVIHRRGMPLANALVVVLLMNVVFVVEIALVSGLGLLAGAAPDSSIMPTLVVISLGLTAVYALIVAIRPAFLSRNETLRWLMDAGLSGHAWAMLYRAPNIVAMIGTQVLFMRCFGIELPLDVSLFYLPAVMFIVGLPVSVQGLGPSQVASVKFFSAYAAVGIANAEASVLACGFANAALMTVAATAIGLCCLTTDTGRESIAAVRSPRPA